MAGLPDLDASDRQSRIAEIRSQIAAGAYETPEKLEQAIEGFLDRLASGGRPVKSNPNPDPKPKPK